MRIGELAERAGMAAQTIRYYERLGLLPRPSREASGYRRYDEAAPARLRFIQSAKLLGLSLDEIGDILQISEAQEAPCPHVLALLEEKRARIDAWLREAQAFRDALDKTIRASRRRLSRTPRAAEACPIIERGLHERAEQATQDAADSPPLQFDQSPVPRRSKGRLGRRQR